MGHGSGADRGAQGGDRKYQSKGPCTSGLHAPKGNAAEADAVRNGTTLSRYRAARVRLLPLIGRTRSKWCHRQDGHTSTTYAA